VTVNATLPHPVFFDQPRTVTVTQSGAKHSEDVVHINAIWMMPVAQKLDIGIFGGPSIFSVKQDAVTAVTVHRDGRHRASHPQRAAHARVEDRRSRQYRRGCAVHDRQEVGRRRARAVYRRVHRYSAAEWTWDE
jgi:hypothetical protein